MTKDEVSNMINATKLPWRQNFFSQTPTPPYVVYYYPSENDVKADNSNYVNRRQLFVELFTKKKDEATEAIVEAELKKAGLSWYKQTDFLNDENLFQTVYECEVIITG